MTYTHLARVRAFGLGCVLAALTTHTVLAQDFPQVEALPNGALLIHGNYCGPGSRGPGYPPVDALDVACAHHDACSPPPTSGHLPRCACHRRLHVEAGVVARNPATPRKVRETARFIADGALALPCDP